MFTSLQNPLALASRLLLAALFLPAGIGKLTGFAGTVGYITSVGLPMPTVAAAIAAAVEVLGSLAADLWRGHPVRRAGAGLLHAGGQLLLPCLLEPAR